jgi:hypothetical protein
LLLSVTLGLHWTVLQSVAWTTMVVKRSQQGSLASAVRTTFDGNHPGGICQLVRAGKSVKDQSDRTMSILRLEAAPSRSTPLWIGAADAVSDRIPSDEHRLGRRDVPPLPPPRTA